MVHPGNTCNGYNYIKEINMLRENNIRDLLHDNKLMTYYDLQMFYCFIIIPLRMLKFMNSMDKLTLSIIIPFYNVEQYFD